MPPNQNQFPAPQQPGPPQQQPQPGQPTYPPQQPQMPQQQWPAPQQPTPQEPGKYDFFMTPEKPKKPSLLGGGMSGMKLYIIAGGIVGVLALIAIAVSAGMSSQKQPSQLLGVTQTQQEIIRVATLGSKSTQSTTLQNFAVTTRVTLASEQQTALAQLKKQGISPKTKTLDAAKNSKTDQALSAALAANTFDITFASTMETELDDYHAKLENASAAATTRAERNLLQKQLSSAELLAKQLQSR